MLARFALDEHVECIDVGYRGVVVNEDFYFSFFLRATAVFDGDFFFAVTVVLVAEVLRLGFSPSADGVAVLRVRFGLASAGGLGSAACCDACSSPATPDAAAVVARRRRAGLVTCGASSGTRNEGGGASTAGGAGRRFHGAIEREGSRGAV